MRAPAENHLAGSGSFKDTTKSLTATRHGIIWEAVYTYEGADMAQSLIVGRELTGFQAFSR